MSQRAVPNMDEPADNTKTLPFECTMSECIMRFGTVKEMKLHKTRDPAHFYCKRCDVDCVDWDDLVQVRAAAIVHASEAEMLTISKAQGDRDVSLARRGKQRQP